MDENINWYFYEDHVYVSYQEPIMEPLPVSVQLPSFMDLVNSQKNHGMSNHIIESSVVDQLNDSDELMNLLSTEENCTAILQNISTNEQFQRLMNEESEFVPTEEIEQLINKIQPQTPQPVIDMIDSNLQIDELTSFNNKNQTEIMENPKINTQTYKCDRCDRIVSTERLLKKHMLIHTKQPDLPCNICGKLFRFNYQLTVHQKSHNKPTFQCKICQQMFIYKSHLNYHVKKHLGEPVETCKDCHMKFKSKKELKEHRTTCHTITESVICDICGKTLNRMSALKEHKLITHNYDKKREFECKVCGKQFWTSRNLKFHMKIHSNIKSYVCNICNKSVSSKACLLTHLKMHTGLKDYNCNICNKNFASKDYLTVHKRIHTGDKPFACNICDKRFSQKNTLTVHIRSHTGQRPYKCECGKQFTTKSHLMTHYKTHDIGGVDIEYITNHFI